jgi:hypothetical protein
MDVTGYQSKHVSLPFRFILYKPEGKRNVIRPKKIWRDQFHLFDDQGTGTVPNASELVIVMNLRI